MANRISPRRLFNNLKLRNKLLLSYVLVGMLPFFVFSFSLLWQANRQLYENAQQSFSSVFDTAASGIQQKTLQIENAVQIVCQDSNMAQILNNHYDSYYDKYSDITKYFDSLLHTVLLATPEIQEMTFYVPNNLAGSRKIFLPLESFTDSAVAESIREKPGIHWFYSDNKLFLYQRIFDPSHGGRFAVLRAEVKAGDLFPTALAESLRYRVLLRGERLDLPGTAADPASPVNRTASFWSGEGELQGFLPKDWSKGIAGKTLLFAELGIAAAFLLLLFAIFLFARSFTRRVDRINLQLSEVVENHFETTLKEDYQDEIGQMTATVNHMIGDARSLMQEVYQSGVKQKEYEMKALQAQMNPHFLYNTLSAINWHALTSDNSKISGIVTALSRFYRTALNQGENITTIQNELENIRAYLEIQLSIHDDSFDVEYEIEDEILRLHMPNLILQPIVENAIEHGVDQKRDGRGLLRICGRRDGVMLRFEISDNGPGLSGDAAKELTLRESKGYGLGNVDKRLQLFFGNRYELQFQNENGVTAVICFPPWEGDA